MQDRVFNELKKLYLAHGHRLYIVGGTCRDLLLGRPYTDEDFATDATPEEEKVFLPEADFTFSAYGAIRVQVGEIRADVTTLRQEGAYLDHRHPSQIRFVKDPALDVVRRDFTINALYLDEEYTLLDYVGGEKDLQSKLIRFVGIPEKRIQEDPLRIIRAQRFSEVLGFSIEEKSEAAIEKYSYLLSELNPEKIKEEERKGWKRIK